MKVQTAIPDSIRGEHDSIDAATPAREGAISPRSLDASTSSGLRSPLEPERIGWKTTLLRAAIGLLIISTIVLIWWVVAVIGNYPAYILPTPLTVAQGWWAKLLDGSLLPHLWTTVQEAGLGFLLALAIGTMLGYLIGHSHLLERLVSPYVAVSQGLPVVAIAPLLVIWFRDDLTRNAAIAALIAFFPMLVNTIVAVRGIDHSMLEVARISGANRLQQIWYVELPLGLRALLGGIKLGLILSITGAVVGEIVSSDAGLGFLLILGRGLFDTTLIFVSLVTLALLTITIYGAVTLLEKVLITWE